MIIEDIKKMHNLQNEFNDACIRVCKFMKRYDSDYQIMHEFELADDDDVQPDFKISCTGWYPCMGESVDVWGEFPVRCLYMTDDELNAYVDELIAEKQKQEELKKQELIYQAEQSERALYEKLKEKYGN